MSDLIQKEAKRLIREITYCLTDLRHDSQRLGIEFEQMDIRTLRCIGRLVADAWPQYDDVIFPEENR